VGEKFVVFKQEEREIRLLLLVGVRIKTEKTFGNSTGAFLKAISPHGAIQVGGRHRQQHQQPSTPVVPLPPAATRTSQKEGIKKKKKYGRSDAEEEEGENNNLGTGGI
jgi:hypothetical protein